MYARAVDEAAARLRELRHEQWEKFGLAAFALGLALAATQAYSPIVMPLFLGGLAVGASGMRALWRHWALLERLAGDRDAYVISEVRDFASREATTERRQGFAAYIRGIARQPAPVLELHVAGIADELEALAVELEDDGLELDPACAVACMRLVSDPAASPLLNPALPTEELRWRVRQIRSGFRPRALAVGDDGDAVPPLPA